MRQAASKADLTQGRADSFDAKDNAALPVSGVRTADESAAYRRIQVTTEGTGEQAGGLPATEGTQSGRRGQASFEQIFHEYAPYVLHCLPHLGVREADMDDVCQEVFLTVHRRLPTFEGRSSLRTWIYGICLRKALNYRRRAHRRYECPQNAWTEPVVASQQVGWVQRGQARSLLQEALAHLSEKKREVFVLYEIEELSMAEVAASVGCPLFTAYARLYAARREIQKAVRRLVPGRGGKGGGQS